jgi:predicted amidohydrolase
MQDLTITCVQSDLKWQDKAFNLHHFEQMLQQADLKTDVIILPEMFSTGFSMEAELLAEKMDGPTIQWMKKLALQYGCAVCGSLIIRDDHNGKFYNRFIWVDENQIVAYNKRHLFSLMNEGEHYTAGTSTISIEYRNWKIQPFVCYDLRFPAWCRNTVNADLQIYVANWPERRIAHWTALLKARAIENQCYVAGVNRVGTDINAINHTGESAIYDCFGTEIAAFTSVESVFTEKLSRATIKKCRDKFPFLNDKDNFTIQ